VVVKKGRQSRYRIQKPPRTLARRSGAAERASFGLQHA
jgi:hypothetical protein